MDKREIKTAFNSLNPTQEQSDQMWERLAPGADKTREIKREQKKTRSFSKFALTAAAAVLVVFSSAVGINAATNGEFVEAIKEFVGIKQTKQDVTGQAAELQERGIEVYAPEINYLDKEYLVFGTLRGVLVYNLEAGALEGTIDTQAVGCIYFNSDSKQTHVVKDEDRLVLFNSESEKLSGNYYLYEMGVGTGQELAVAETGSDEAVFDKYYDLWKRAEKNYTDTFSMFADDPVMGQLIQNDKDDPAMYGRRSYSWTNAAGEEKLSFLTLKHEQYVLNTYDKAASTFTEKVIDLEAGAVGGATEEVVLPEFVYSGDNKAIASICDYVKTDYYDSYASEGTLFMPAFVIVKEVQEGDDYLVFGNFWSYGYMLNGRILEVSSGGEMPACFHLKATDEGYEVVEVERAGDGADYAKDIREFTRNYPGLYEEFSMTEEERTAARKEFLQMYIRDNNLDIEYYKDYGWDPVKIFE